MPSIEQKYNEWRSAYVRAWGELLYIDYNKKGEVEQKNAITCSEGKKGTADKWSCLSEPWNTERCLAPAIRV